MSEKSFSYQPLAQSPPPYQEAVVLMPVSKNGQQQPMFLSPVPILCAPFVAMPQVQSPLILTDPLSLSLSVDCSSSDTSSSVYYSQFSSCSHSGFIYNTGCTCSRDYVPYGTSIDLVFIG